MEDQHFCSVMAVDRALLVDSLPSPGQPQGNAWAARMTAVGAIVGFFTCVSVPLLLESHLDGCFMKRKRGFNQNTSILG